MPRRKKTDDTLTATKQVASKTYEKEIQQLLERGKKDGKLEQHKIFELIPDTPANIDILEQLYAEMAEEAIDMILPEAPTAEEIKDEDEWVVEADVEETLPEDTSYLDDIA